MFWTLDCFTGYTKKTIKMKKIEHKKVGKLSLIFELKHIHSYLPPNKSYTNNHANTNF